MQVYSFANQLNFALKKIYIFFFFSFTILYLVNLLVFPSILVVLKEFFKLLFRIFFLNYFFYLVISICIFTLSSDVFCQQIGSVSDSLKSHAFMW